MKIFHSFGMLSLYVLICGCGGSGNQNSPRLPVVMKKGEYLLEYEAEQTIAKSEILVDESGNGTGVVNYKEGVGDLDIVLQSDSIYYLSVVIKDYQFPSFVGDFGVLSSYGQLFEDQAGGYVATFQSPHRFPDTDVRVRITPKK